MPTFTLFEHERLPFSWTDRHMAELERLNRSLGREMLRATTWRGQKVLQARAHVGVVRFGRQTVQVLPKIDASGEDRAARERSAARNLVHMLAQVGDFPIREHEVAPLLRQNRDWFEILTRLFATHLMTEWQRGPHSNYQRVNRWQTAMKGCWRIDDQLRRPGRDHVFAVTYDEFTRDNPLNRVFRFVVEQLWRQTWDAGNRQMLGELRQWLDEAALPSVLTVDDATPQLLNRLNRRFEPLLNLARLFIGSQTPQLATGRDETFAFVFDMNALFEAFVIETIRRYRQQILPAALRACSLHPQARRHARYLASIAGTRQVFRLHPDLAFHNARAQNEPFPLLLDTKYKRLRSADARLGISQDDFYQMFAYAHRYHCPRVLLLYPQVNDSLRRRFDLQSMPDSSILAATLNLHVDLSSPRGRQSLTGELHDIFRYVQAPDTFQKSGAVTPPQEVIDEPTT